MDESVMKLLLADPLLEEWEAELLARMPAAGKDSGKRPAAPDATAKPDKALQLVG